MKPMITPPPLVDLDLRQVREPTTFYFSGLENETAILRSDQIVVNSNGAYHFAPRPTGPDDPVFGLLSTACIQSVSQFSGDLPTTAHDGGPCEMPNCLACVEYCGTQYLMPDDPSSTPLSHLFCMSVPNYVVTLYRSVFLRRIEASETSLDPASSSAESEINTTPVGGPILPEDTSVSEASSCPPIPPSAATSTVPSSGTIATIAVPSVVGTLALASLIFFLILRSRTRKLMAQGYGTTSEKPGVIMDPNMSTVHRRLSK